MVQLSPEGYSKVLNESLLRSGLKEFQSGMCESCRRFVYLTQTPTTFMYVERKNMYDDSGRYSEKLR